MFPHSKSSMIETIFSQGVHRALWSRPEGAVMLALTSSGKTSWPTVTP